ncbi:GntR family transcriptional regulator [Pedobacter sp. HMWF019]|uniref:aminotransferase-like domain-containing protein n=1 Tax=Pedobacter sp. HMWF019 TaxID=2056856 RepID=UPI000D336675|nr:PLP-dependent aminotransferase family protein [Pedobacter sp. HMWF019]PTS99026.1 GntR family transcriptional regulator [Pedobacter sp. HMWF019]
MQILATLIVIDRDSIQPVYQQLANRLMQLIKDGTLPVSHRLLSTRKMAELLKIHRKTVVRAYDELLAQGWLESEGGNGTFVSSNLPKLELKNPSAKNGTKVNVLKNAGFSIGNADHLKRKINKTTQSYHLDDGYPDSRLAPLTELSRAYRTQLLTGNSYVRFGYGDTKGSLLLREELCTYFAETRGLNIDTENILITRGTVMGLYLVSAALITPGEHVVVTELGWKAASMNFLQAQAIVHKIAVDEHGMVVDELRRLCLVTKIRLVYLTPHHHYPTTVPMRADRRIQLLSLAEEFGFIIFEDDYDYDFHYMNRPLQPLVSADKTGHVIYCGSFTKSIAPAFRVGYLVAPENVIQQLAQLRRIVDRQGDFMLENSIAELFKLGTIQKHLRKSLRVYRERRDVFCDLIKHHLNNKIHFQVPEGGMAVWAIADLSIDIQDLSFKALKKDIYINDGSGFGEAPTINNNLRLGFASSNVAELEYIVETIAKLL